LIDINLGTKGQLDMATRIKNIISTVNLPFTYSGNTTKLASVTGSFISGVCKESDASGNIKDSANGLPCGSGGGSSGPTYPLLTLTSNILTFGVNCIPVTANCNIRNGSIITTLTTSVPTISSPVGSGNWRIYVAIDGTLTLALQSGLTATSGGSFTQVIANSYPDDAVLLYSGHVTVNVFDSVGTNWQASSGGPRGITAGTNISLTKTGNNVTINNTASGVPTLTNSFLIIPSDSSAGISNSFNSGVIYCADFPLYASLSLTTAYTDIHTAVAASVFGVALYDASGNRLTGATQTGTSTAVPNVVVNVTFGGGTVTINPGSDGKASMCYTSNAGNVLNFFSPDSTILAAIVQPSGNPILYTATNTASFASPTITWPATLGVKVPVNGGNIPTTLIMP
jgi:hypothetical protein